MKYIKRFSKVSDYEAFRGGGEYITPNISLIDDGKRVYSEKKVNNKGKLITFTVNGTEYQAEEGMTFYDWALSEYYDSSCQLILGRDGNLRDTIIQENVSSGDSFLITYGEGASIIPGIFTDTIIQPISYIVNFGGFEG